MNEQKENLSEQSHIQLHQKIEDLVINLNKEAKDLYTKNYEALIKSLTKTQINGNSLYPRLGKLILFKCPYYPKQSTDSV